MLLALCSLAFYPKFLESLFYLYWGKGGSFKGILRTAGAGVLLDLCFHVILMVAIKLYERGVSAGQVIAFLLASPWDSFSLTLVLIDLIGFFWTMVFFNSLL